MLKKIVLYLTLAYALIGFIVLPLVLKPQIIKIVEKETNSKLSIETIYFNPFLFRLELSKVKLKSMDNKKIVSFNSFLVDIEPHSLVQKAIHIKDIIVLKPEIEIIKYKNKRVNLLNILKDKVDNKESKDNNKTVTIPRIIVDNISIKNGNLQYKDFTIKDNFKFSFNKIGFSLKNVDTNDFNNSNAKIRFYSTLGDGGFIDLKSSILGFKPLIVDGNLNFKANKLYSEWKYIKEKINLEVADGKISFNTHYHLNLDDLNQTTIDNTNFYINKLRVIPKNGHHDILYLENLAVSDIVVKPFLKTIEVKEVALNSLKINAKRDSRAKIDWINYVKVSNSSTKTELKKRDNKSKSKPWDIKVDDMALRKISLNLEDKSLKPKVISNINELNVYAQDITLAGKKPFSYQLDMLMNSKFKCNSHGEIIHNILDIKSNTICKEFNLVHYRPYIDQLAKQELKVFNTKLISGVIDLGANVELKVANNHTNIFVNDTNITLSNFILNRYDNRERILNIGSFNIVGIDLDSSKKSINIKNSSLNRLNLKGIRYKNRKLNFENLIVSKIKRSKIGNSKIKTKTKSVKKPYKINLEHFALKSAKITFLDKVLSPSTKNTLDRIRFDAYNINLAKRSWLKYNFFARVNSKGYIKSKGKLRHTPLKQRGTFELKNIGLTALNPYIQEKAFVNIDDGKLSLKTKTYYSVSKNHPDLRVKGSIDLKDFFISDIRDNSSIMSLVDLKLKSTTFELNPNRLYIDEVDLTSFYVDAKIDENKQMNLAKLMKTTDANNSVKSVENNESKKVKFPIKILQINVSSGSARFADYSIPLKFQTDIHELNGAIYSVSNIPGETSYVDISGDVDKYGSTKLKGSVNSANPKEYTDLNFNFKNLELSSLSGYSASFAGHEIDEGKLYLDLGYKINNSELLGKNSIIIKKIKLGREIKDENITVLPLGFVIALLEDSDGIIDINMPVEGDLNKPDFKYGTLIWKTLGNLITKAVTSPFRFLGSMMGFDGAALEYAEFELGNAKILPTEREKLDNIAKMMIKRPKISLSISPTYDGIKDKKILQRDKLVSLVLKKSGIQNEKNHKNAMTVEMLETIYKEYKDDDKLKLMQDRLHKKYKEDTFDRAYLSSLAELCITIQKVSKVELENLANSRVKMIKDYLINERNVKPSRIIKNSIKIINNSEGNLVKLDLKVEVN